MNDTLAATAAPRTDWFTPLELIALGAIWGGSFLFMRVAAPQFGPFALVEVRIVLGALILLPFLWHARALLDAKRIVQFAIVGALNSAIPFSLFAWGAERAPAGVGAIANSLTVLFTALVALLVYGERVSLRRALAMIVGFVGVVVLMSGKVAGSDVFSAALAGTAASACYGVAANFTRRWFAGVPPLAAVAGTLGSAAILLAPFALASWPAQSPSGASWGSAIALGVLCTGIAYALFFRLIQRVGAARATTCTYLVPLFGVFWGWLLLAETPTVTMLVAGTMILGSVIASQREAQARR
ncbi:DMT family transporter [Dokdonella fugitiva]|jgi:drug/metabolite transporter (DMT)-like permease|uniref:DMT family transporter n=1 Tax=Dokdonella fugitiva TaxID=328517 RepID=UPI0015FCEF0F|nr:EamA family transporter [Dokdonella fugitiva]MBA8882757.1 drug/metabolite transporter (DMT)-like permease [Dokdonella fugitiva]